MVEEVHRSGASPREPGTQDVSLPFSKPNGPIRVAVVEDSPTILRKLTRWIEESPEFILVGTASDGSSALDLLKTRDADIVSMDVRLPGGDGIQICREVMRSKPTRILIFTGAEKNGKLAFQALRAGALGLLEKSAVLESARGKEAFLQKLRLFSQIRLVRLRFPTDPVGMEAISSDPPTPPRPRPPSRPGPMPPRVLGIVASTGAPTVLFETFARLPPDFPVPIVVTLHIQAQFQPRLLDWLREKSQIPVYAAEAGASLAAPGITFAPAKGGLWVQESRRLSIRKAIPTLSSGDTMLESLAESFGAQAAGLILSGMGSDGSRGMEKIFSAGGETAIQEYRSCVVPSMPRMAAAFAKQRLPVHTIANWIQSLDPGKGVG